jgi:hypothetical protein
MTEDQVQKRLAELGASQVVVDGGLNGLVKKWESIAEEIASGYKLDRDSYLNDLDVRQLIEEVVTTVSDLAPELLTRIRNADELTKRSTVASKCVWGEGVARREGWTEKKNWWYFVEPKEMSDML